MFLLLFSVSIFASSKKPIPKVTMEVLKKSEFTDVLKVPALIKSRTEANIKSDSKMIVIQSLVSLGQKIKKGDKLIELRNQDTSVVYQNRILKSPVDGVIASIAVEKGQFIDAGENLIFINNPDDLYIKAEIPMKNIKQLSLGLKGEMRLLETEKMEIEVEGIGAVVDSLSGTVPVTFKITSNHQHLLPGVMGQVNIDLNKTSLLMVSDKALYYDGNDVLIPILEKGKVKKMKVTLGTRKADKVEILSGLSVGQEIISGSGAFLKNGDTVEVMKK
jgi:multidrug efflux pump subunit AcrA (membrane-fusion protein)